MKQPTYEQVLQYLRLGGKAKFKRWADDQYLYWKDESLYISRCFEGDKDVVWEQDWHDRLLWTMKKEQITLLPMENAPYEAAKLWLELGGRAQRNGGFLCTFYTQDGKLCATTWAGASCKGATQMCFDRGRRVANSRYNLLPDEPKAEAKPEIIPPTRTEVIDHLRNGGLAQWKNGKLGVWFGNMFGELMWKAQGAKCAQLSKHDCNGHWFADFTDEEIANLELLPFPKVMPMSITYDLAKQQYQLLKKMVSKRPYIDFPPTKKPEPKPSARVTALKAIAHLKKGGKVEWMQKNSTFGFWDGILNRTFVFSCGTDGALMSQFKPSGVLKASSYDGKWDAFAKHMEFGLKSGDTLALLPPDDPKPEKKEEAKPAPITPEQARAHLFKGGEVRARRIGCAEYCYRIKVMFRTSISEGFSDLSGVAPEKWFVEPKYEILELL